MNAATIGVDCVCVCVCVIFVFTKNSTKLLLDAVWSNETVFHSMRVLCVAAVINEWMFPFS